VVAVQVRDAYSTEPSEAQRSSTPLQLGPLATVEEIHVAFILDGDGSGLTLERRQRGPAAKDYSSKHDARMVAHGARRGARAAIRIAPDC